MSIKQNEILSNGINRIGDVLERIAVSDDKFEDVKMNIRNLHQKIGGNFFDYYNKI